MNFNSIRIVLVATSHPGNIGSAARAMKTMGFSRLYLVSPKIFPDLKAFEMAAGADDVLEQCIVTSSLREALQGCQLVIGTSARPRGIDLPGLIPKDCAKLIAEHADNIEVALVFGREHAGLTNEELLQCHYHVTIPSNPDYSSLNLAQAVQVITYELRMHLLATTIKVNHNQDKLATVDEVEQFYTHLTDVLLEVNFLKPDNPRRLQERLRRLFNRVGLEQMEVNILRGILTYTQKALQRHKGNKLSED
ncbi:RNA methyltransferase [Legionella beliardensis]|uniref:tRNA (cytidine/uridine-2'-O-)-methyltransferase TrmJ n=1 Tax=Legionella beliardensis TaxID=91822 RepID=A0A378HZR2_9GAMM|nr:tRNA (cytosine(32)/uridine(32)-2'-O)-methyltransferase TrmJ [Legionella beliardensis]STX28223.1 RNA methyltransferase [Legionella beliardensis]